MIPLGTTAIRLRGFKSRDSEAPCRISQLSESLIIWCEDEFVQSVGERFGHWLLSEEPLVWNQAAGSPIKVIKIGFLVSKCKIREAMLLGAKQC
ncbi:hypothetical protein Pan241w_23180 [Gimesia alba]|uniref:Uncharacterized protein n=1 Tax=Gimesia alba TaxID=2527973 RepID=A0A517REC9_9PLAN|nr:hypothetical protein Pan241w_23180 [Gimesia alba]